MTDFMKIKNRYSRLVIVLGAMFFSLTSHAANFDEDLDSMSSILMEINDPNQVIPAEEANEREARFNQASQNALDYFTSSSNETRPELIDKLKSKLNPILSAYVGELCSSNDKIALPLVGIHKPYQGNGSHGDDHIYRLGHRLVEVYKAFLNQDNNQFDSWAFNNLFSNIQTLEPLDDRHDI